MFYGNEADNIETYCYVVIEPLYNTFYRNAAYLLDNSNLIESPFGKKEVYINEYGDMQIKSSYLILIDCDTFINKKNRVFYLYNGSLIVGGIVRQWSKVPIEFSKNKVEEYKKIQKEIDNLRFEQHKLFKKTKDI